MQVRINLLKYNFIRFAGFIYIYLPLISSFIICPLGDSLAAWLVKQGDILAAKVLLVVIQLILGISFFVAITRYINLGRIFCMSATIGAFVASFKLLWITLHK